MQIVKQQSGVIFFTGLWEVWEDPLSNKTKILVHNFTEMEIDEL